MSKRFLVIGVLILLLCAGLVGFNIFRSQMMAAYFAHAGRPPVAVEAVTVKKVTWSPGIEAVGTARAEQGADLAAQAAGIVRAINFASGDKATQGELLVQIDDATEQADMASAQANITLNRRKLDRMTPLKSKGYVSQQDWDNTKAQLDVARAAYMRASAQAALKAIKAPFDGELGIPQINIGQFVEMGHVIVTLQELDQMKVDFTVGGQDASEIKVGQSVRFGISQGDYPFTGRVIGIDPKVDPKTRLVSVQALLDNHEHKVLPGQFLRVRIELGAEPNVLAVPQTAVIASLYGDYVYVVASSGEGKNAKMTAVQTFVDTGRRELGSIEIKSGLKAGERIISAGQNKLQNNAPIILQANPQASASGGAG